MAVVEGPFRYIVKADSADGVPANCGYSPPVVEPEEFMLAIANGVAGFLWEMEGSMAWQITATEAYAVMSPPHSTKFNEAAWRRINVQQVSWSTGSPSQVGSCAYEAQVAWSANSVYASPRLLYSAAGPRNLVLAAMPSGTAEARVLELEPAADLFDTTEWPSFRVLTHRRSRPGHSWNAVTTAASEIEMKLREMGVTLLPGFHGQNYQATYVDASIRHPEYSPQIAAYWTMECRASSDQLEGKPAIWSENLEGMLDGILQNEHPGAMALSATSSWGRHSVSWDWVSCALAPFGNYLLSWSASRGRPLWIEEGSNGLDLGYGLHDQPEISFQFSDKTAQLEDVVMEVTLSGNLLTLRFRDKAGAYLSNYGRFRLMPSHVAGSSYYVAYPGIFERVKGQHLAPYSPTPVTLKKTLRYWNSDPLNDPPAEYRFIDARVVPRV